MGKRTIADLRWSHSFAFAAPGPLRSLVEMAAREEDRRNREALQRLRNDPPITAAINWTLAELAQTPGLDLDVEALRREFGLPPREPKIRGAG